MSRSSFSKKLEPGVTLWFAPDQHRRNGGAGERIVVEKVGRRWAYARIEWRHGSRFDVETGVVDGKGFSSPGRVYDSEESWQARVRAQRALLRLKAALDYRTADQLGVDEETVTRAAELLGLSIREGG